MFNLFKNSEKLINSMNNPNKNYWEKSTNNWDRNVYIPESARRGADAPNMNYYDEYQMCQDIQMTDRNRLIRFSSNKQQ